MNTHQQKAPRRYKAARRIKPAHLLMLGVRHKRKVRHIARALHDRPLPIVVSSATFWFRDVLRSSVRTTPLFGNPPFPDNASFRAAVNAPLPCSGSSCASYLRSHSQTQSGLCHVPA